MRLHPKAIYLFWFKSFLGFLKIIYGFIGAPIFIIIFIYWQFVASFLGGELPSFWKIVPPKMILLGAGAIFLGGAVLSGLKSFIDFLGLSYEITPVGITIKKGILYKREITISFEKICNIDLYPTGLSYFLGLSSVHIEYSSGYYHSLRAKEIIPALSLEQAKRLREEWILKKEGKPL